MLLVLQVYTYVKSYEIIHFKYMQFISYQLHRNKTIILFIIFPLRRPWKNLIPIFIDNWYIAGSCVIFKNIIQGRDTFMLQSTLIRSELALVWVTFIQEYFMLTLTVFVMNIYIFHDSDTYISSSKLHNLYVIDFFQHSWP